MLEIIHEKVVALAEILLKRLSLKSLDEILKVFALAEILETVRTGYGSKENSHSFRLTTFFELITLKNKH